MKNIYSIVFYVVSIATVVLGQDFGPCIGGFCPAGATCNSAGTCVSPAATCSDIATNCAANINLCNNSLYFELMTQKCQKTCNRCSGNGSGGSCTDVASSCPVAYCTNAIYRDLMMQKCRKTCGFC